MNRNSSPLISSKKKRRVRLASALRGSRAVLEAADRMERSSKRKDAIRRANLAREKYAGSQKLIVNEYYPAGPSIGKESRGVRIVATNDIHFEEPKFG
ncbi:hypothetical protein [Brevibacillus migulae]|uniref:hypothetical protein n=1 Tax=Brevibacillus migulae TaxID=1644114 RepID=UPI00106EE03C|nr:hypothetical protein [Brevibacillus migulae]